ncbi:MAG: hypothetical protein JO231_06195 [Acidobacteria bacterium]|nr:hypothetical protein [Acidobacteriota bacterium]
MADAQILMKAQTVNDEYRTAALNRKYYGCRLQTVKRQNLTCEILLAFSSSSAVAAWSLWQTETGSLAWKILSAVAAIIAIVKPLLALDKDIERYSELVVGYAALYYDMRKLIADAKINSGVAAEDWARFESFQQRMAALGVKDDLRARQKLHDRCYDEVLSEIPDSALWWPLEEIA